MSMVPLVPFTTKLLLGAILSVTLPIMMLITANVPEGTTNMQKKSEDAPFGSCQWTCGLTHQWRCVWMCQRWSKPAPGRVRCTGRTLAVRRPGAHTPCLVLRKRNRSLCHGSDFLGYPVPGFCSSPLSFLPSCLQEKQQLMTNQLSPPPFLFYLCPFYPVVEFVLTL